MLFKRDGLKQINKELAQESLQRIDALLESKRIRQLVRVNASLEEAETTLDRRLRRLEELRKGEKLGNMLYLFFRAQDESVLQKRVAELKKLKSALQAVTGIKDIGGFVERLQQKKMMVSKRRGLLDKEVICYSREIRRELEIEVEGKKLARFSLLAFLMGFGVQAAVNAYQAGGVYDAFRRVNPAYVNESDTEIWWDMVMLGLSDPAAMTGMVNLVKGAYFEQLVAQESGGVLHADFNHPETDITIDGIEYQLKATDSADYVDSVNPDIPVISTHEVAAQTDTIDSGISNEHLDETTESALGGDILDVADALETGVSIAAGTIGFIPVMHGLVRMGQVLEQNNPKATDDLTYHLDSWFEAVVTGAETTLEVFLQRLPYVWDFLLSIIRVPLNVLHAIFKLIFRL
ncbi:hypothetical protein [Microbulbifer pacificus]|uniref:Uncharacterized protein n=1 Tax=Microbulbifer pacificus TaxID=407164 RepID=A0AAU0N214_9GAMM|nr:hypothetical protein [Microbulbifer pacificus]WOX05961.1 hypothetical protein R5R33_02130 [Microbulbifer pacificus]